MWMKCPGDLWIKRWSPLGNFQLLANALNVTVTQGNHGVCDISAPTVSWLSLIFRTPHLLNYYFISFPSRLHACISPIIRGGWTICCRNYPRSNICVWVRRKCVTRNGCRTRRDRYDASRWRDEGRSWGAMTRVQVGEYRWERAGVCERACMSCVMTAGDWWPFRPVWCVRSSYDVPLA